MPAKGQVWNHFKEASDSVLCNHCTKSYSKATAKSSTNPLWYHLKVQHNIHPEKSIPPRSSTKKPTTMKLITSYVEKKSQQKMYAELAATDRLSFNQIAKSEFIHDSMRLQKFSAHSSPTTIRKKVLEFYQEAKDAVICELKERKSEGCRFAVSFDEWTGKNRRYLTVNVHSKGADFYNLGMVRVWSSQTAETILKLVTLRLHEFGLELHHIVAFVTDGASIMMKLGRLAPCDHVVCLSHTLHLVIADVFYKKNTVATDNDETESEEQQDAHQDDESDDDIEDDDDACLPSLDNNNGLAEEPPTLIDDIEPVINKVRRIVNKFRKSPVKNDLLQKEVTLVFNEELTLLRDCKTRWSSMFAMLQRFLRIHVPVHKVLQELELGILHLTEVELMQLRSVVDCLEPFQVATNFLCERTSTLAQAEATIQFICSKLQTLNTDLSLKLLERLKERYLKRRNTQMVSIAKFFDDPSCFSNQDSDEFKMPSKSTVLRSTKALHGRLFAGDGGAVHPSACETQQTASATESNLAGELSEFIKSKHVTGRQETDTFSKEFNLHVSGGVRTKSLQEVHEAVLVVPPTSVEAERVFSAAGLYLTKIRCRMSDATLNILIFLKFYFKRLKKDSAKHATKP